MRFRLLHQSLFDRLHQWKPITSIQPQFQSFTFGFAEYILCGSAGFGTADHDRALHGACDGFRVGLGWRIVSRFG